MQTTDAAQGLSVSSRREVPRPVLLPGIQRLSQACPLPEPLSHAGLMGHFPIAALFMLASYLLLFLKLARSFCALSLIFH